jgi:hypothetical protein
MGSWTGRTVQTSTAASIAHRSGVYEGVKVNTVRTLYVDNDRIGTSFAAVDPSR